MICINKTTHLPDPTEPTSVSTHHNLRFQDKDLPSISRDPPHNTLELDNSKHPSMFQDPDNSQAKDHPSTSQDLAHILEKDNIRALLVRLHLILKDHQSVFPVLAQEIIQDKDSFQLSKPPLILRDLQLVSPAQDHDSMKLITIHHLMLEAPQ